MWSEALEKLADEIIALIVVISTVIFIALRIDVPQWWSTAFGMVISFYFMKKTVKRQKEGKSE